MGSSRLRGIIEYIKVVFGWEESIEEMKVI